MPSDGRSEDTPDAPGALGLSEWRITHEEPFPERKVMDALNGPKRCPIGKLRNGMLNALTVADSLDEVVLSLTCDRYQVLPPMVEARTGWGMHWASWLGYLA